MDRMTSRYKFGKLPQRVDVRTFQLSKLFVKKLLPTLPSSYDIDSEFSGFVDHNMFGNDTYGDCVIAGRAHMTLRFEEYEQSLLIGITDKEVEDEYFKETGGGDDGLVMLDSLNLWRNSGWVASGKQYNIYAFAQIKVSNHDELKYAVYLLRGAYTGFNVPQSAMDQFDAGQPWTVSGDNTIIGGHCVFIKGYNATGPICVTWGADQQMTWEFWDTYFDEAYALIDDEDTWVDPSIDPLNIPLLTQYLNEITDNPTPVTTTNTTTTKTTTTTTKTTTTTTKTTTVTTPPPTPSPCQLGNGVARILSFVAKVLHRKGRFYYRNP